MITMSTSNPSASKLNSQVSLNHVLRLAVHAAYGACEIIQTLASRGTTKVELKDITDPKSALTEADELAQAYILELFAHSFPEINVVGEEDEASSETIEKLTTLTKELQTEGRLKLYEEHFSENLEEGNDLERNLRFSKNSSYLFKYQNWLKESIEKKLNSNSLDADSKSYLLSKIGSDRICIFIDPLDGTGEFVAKRYEAVQTQNIKITFLNQTNTKFLVLRCQVQDGFSRDEIDSYSR